MWHEITRGQKTVTATRAFLSCKIKSKAKKTTLFMGFEYGTRRYNSFALTTHLWQVRYVKRLQIMIRQKVAN